MQIGRRLLLVAACVGLAFTAAPSASAQTAGVAAPAVAGAPVSATELAGRITALTQQAAALQARRAALEQQLAAAEQTVKDVTARKGVLEANASKLLVEARQQALNVYVKADPAAAPFAVAAAVSQGNVNDVAWTLGLMHVTHERTMSLAKEAKQLRDSADSELVQALEARDRINVEMAKLAPAVEAAKNDVQLAQTDLDAFVLRLGPSTIAGLTTTAYEAYRRAASTIAVENPKCGLRWELLAAIGKTESNHGSGRLDANGTALPPIVGPSVGPDTDQGQLDGDPNADHAVGPMQFIPSTWRNWAADGNGDGIADINNVFDESLAAGRYLCNAAGALTLLTRDGVVQAILSYNPSQEYLRVVGARFEALARDVANGWFSTADLPTPAVLIGGVNRPPVDGGVVPPPEQPTPPPAPTELRTVALVGPSSVLVAASPEVPGYCVEQSAALKGRAGFLRCIGPSNAILDPCQVTPFDPTLAVCIGDPEKPARLVRTTYALPVTPPAGGAPYFALVLDGNDRCLPTGTTNVPAAPPPPPPPATTAAPTTGVAPGKSAVLRQTSTDPSSTQASTTAPSSTSAPTTQPPATEPPTTQPPTTQPPTTQPPTTQPPTTQPPTTQPPTTQPPTTATTVPPTTAPPVTTPAIAAAPGGGTGYVCGSGAVIQGQPNTSSGTWTVTVVQPGLAPRTVAVRLAFV